MAETAGRGVDASGATLRRRSPWIAAALALVQPLLAFLYLGRPRIALLLFALVAALAVALGHLPLPFPGYAALAAAQLAAIVAIAVGAFRTARRGGPVAPRWYTRWWALVPIYLAVMLLAPPGLWLGRGAENYSITSGSMRPTLEPGDRLRGYPPGAGGGPGWRRGDVVVHLLDDGTPFVHRVVGLPGDRVTVRGGVPWVNGGPLEQGVRGPYHDPEVAGSRVRERSADGLAYEVLDLAGAGGVGDEWPEREVPAGHLFVLGDNRDNSLDSRHEQVGFVPLERAVVRPAFVYWSDDLGRVGTSLLPRPSG
jgi:signal peptidase I